MRTWLTLVFVSAVLAAAVSVLALGGIEGTMEYAIDAPWRIEPSINSAGTKEYGAIPVHISIHDTDNIDLDSPRRRFGHFCTLTIEETTPGVIRRRHFDLDDFAEIEQSGPWLSTISPPPTHEVCRPDESADRCERMRVLSNTAEWHAVAWYYPATRTEGSDAPLTFTAKVTRGRTRSCTSSDPSDFVTLTNHATVHLGEEALPRFDDRWLYGDLHYHSQGTDNEGESGYNYRGVIRAMGALGLDFAFAMEHASNSRQTIDAEVDAVWCGVEGTVNTNALRDMSSRRFGFLRKALHDATGVNRTAALDGPGERLPQNYLSHGVIPQIFLGGEVDAIPEAATGDRHIAYGNGLSYDTNRLGHGKNAWADCLWSSAYTLREKAANGWLIRDVQGLNDADYGREHLIYLPGDGTDDTAFVASDTGRYGGGGRRLADVHALRAPLLPEITKKGYAFLAHPLNDGDGGPGPDGPPWSEFMIRKAWQSKGILGLQFWNEPTRRSTDVGLGDSAELGYDFDGSFIDKQANLAESERLGFARGQFELRPYYNMATRSFESWSRGLEWRLHHGAFTWDWWLLQGLDTSQTRWLSFLPDYEPRRFFVAAGSDAHGDLSYRREGYFQGTTKISDVAIAKARNLVFAGDPAPRSEMTPGASAGQPERHSQEQVVGALAAGNFAATDGPALRIVVDRNGNRQIDDGDTPMGGVVELHGEPLLPLIVQWRSTAEFRGVTRISIYVGARNDEEGSNGKARVYAPRMHGPRNGAELPDDTAVETYRGANGRTYTLMQDNYWRDPTGRLLIAPSTPMGGERVVMLPLKAFEADQDAPGDRFYVRAFAETAIKDGDACETADRARVMESALRASGVGRVLPLPTFEAQMEPARQGACVRHYALTNPIWAITKTSINGCQPSPRALDRDGDGLPDGCDPVP